MNVYSASVIFKGFSANKIIIASSCYYNIYLIKNQRDSGWTVHFIKKPLKNLKRSIILRNILIQGNTPRLYRYIYTKSLCILSPSSEKMFNFIILISHSFLGNLIKFDNYVRAGTFLWMS